MTVLSQPPATVCKRTEAPKISVVLHLPCSYLNHRHYFLANDILISDYPPHASSDATVFIDTVVTRTRVEPQCRIASLAGNCAAIT